jgi:preprotein translocase subunit YajC
MTNLLMLLAQSAPGAATSQPASPFSGNMFFGLMLAALVFFWYWSSSSRKRERQKYDDMLKSLKRNDRVQTYGGMLGTVVEVREKEGEVVLKVDENTNTKIRFNRGAIKEVVRDAPEVTS